MTNNEPKSSYQDRMEKSNNIIADTLSEIFKQPDLFEAFLDVMSKFNYSACDSLIIAKMIPYASSFMTFDEWNNKGYRIIKDETGYTFPDLDNGKEVWFDLSQTRKQKDTVPIETAEEEKIKSPEEKMRSLMSNNRFRFLTVSKPDRTNNRPAYFDPENKFIFIDRTATFEELYPALAAEMAHSYLFMKLKDGYSRDKCETIAQMASYIICKKNKVMPDSIQIPKDLQELDTDEVKTLLDHVKSVTDKIENNIKYFYESGKDAFQRPEVNKTKKTEHSQEQAEKEEKEEKEEDNTEEQLPQTNEKHKTEEPAKAEFFVEDGPSMAPFSETATEKFTPFLNAAVLRHSQRLDNLSVKRAACEDKIALQQKEISRLESKAERLETTCNMLKIIAERSEIPNVKMLLEKEVLRNRERINCIRTEKIPRCGDKIAVQMRKIESLDKKYSIVECKISRCKQLDKLVKSFTILDNQKRSLQFIEAMNGLHDTSILLLKDKIELCSLKIEKYRVKSGKIESHAEKQKLENKIVKVKSKRQMYIDKMNKLNNVIIPHMEQTQNTDKVIKNTETIIKNAVDNDNIKSTGQISDMIIEKGLALLPKNFKSEDEKSRENKQTTSVKKLISEKKKLLGIDKEKYQPQHFKDNLNKGGKI